MKCNYTLATLLCLLFTYTAFSQTITNDYYRVNQGIGKGIKFWDNSSNFKIHMGYGSNHQYGPVRNISIKMNMSENPNNGWVWGKNNEKPIAGLNTLGNFQIQGTMTTIGRVVIKSSNEAKGTTGTGGLEIDGGLRIDKNEIITNTNEKLFLNQDNNGDVIFDSNTLRVDASENRVGIGTWAPGSKLTVKSTTNEYGITSNNPNGISHFPHENGYSYVSGKGIIFRADSNDGSTQRMSITTNGKVLIGTIPGEERLGSYKLYVENGILTEKLKVAVKGLPDWADYVFEDDYDMMSIDQLDEYISENKHLPNVPSAKEVVKNGLDVAKMDAKLLEKIEEAHLYIIELHKELEKLKTQINSKQ